MARAKTEAKKNRFGGKEKFILFFLVIVIIWMFGNMLIHNVQVRFVKTQTISTQKLEDTVIGYGQVSGGEYNIIAQADGTVEPVVKEGERVRKGNAVCKINGSYSWTNHAGRVSYLLDGLEGVTDLNAVCMTDLETRYRNQQKNQKESERSFQSGDVCAKVINVFDDVYLYLTVPMNDYVNSLAEGDSVLLRFADMNYEIHGKLEQRLDTQDNHVYLKLRLRGVKESLFDRRLHEVTLPYNQQNCFAIPQEALVEKNGETGVYYLVKGFVYWKAVTPGEVHDNRIIITEGLKEGNIIVTTPKMVREGSKIK